jgi:hypothetical protein
VGNIFVEATFEFSQPTLRAASYESSGTAQVDFNQDVFLDRDLMNRVNSKMPFEHVATL